MTLTRFVHWDKKLCRFCSVKLIHHFTGHFELCHSWKNGGSSLHEKIQLWHLNVTERMYDIDFTLPMICTFSIWSFNAIICNYRLHTKWIFVIIILRRRYFPKPEVFFIKIFHFWQNLFLKRVLIVQAYEGDDNCWLLLAF